VGDARFCVARSSARKNKLAFLSTDDLTAECLTSFAEIEPAHAHSLSQLWRLLLRLRSLATVGEAGRRGTALLSVRGKPGGVLCRHWRSRFAAFFAASGRALANTPAAFFAAKMFRRPTWGRGSARRRRSLPQRNRARGGAGRRRLFFRRRSGGSPPITASTRPSSALVAEIYRRFDVRRRAGRKRGGAAACRPAGGTRAERRVFCGGRRRASGRDPHFPPIRAHRVGATEASAAAFFAAESSDRRGSGGCLLLLAARSLRRERHRARIFVFRGQKVGFHQVIQVGGCLQNRLEGNVALRLFRV